MNGSPAPAPPRPYERTADRFGQLTFTAVDEGDGPGGWRARPAEGLDPAEQRSLESAITTQLATVRPIPAYPTPEEARALPRRLLYAPAAGGAAYWHTAPAGLDATGRPGNVFVHVVLDRRPHDPEPAFRPSDLWRSPRWLTPFGHPQVLDAVRGALPVPPWADGPLRRGQVLDFLLDPGHWRMDVFAALLDAVAAAMTAGRPVVLAVDSPESGACWIAAVSHLMAPAASRRFHWSTLESPTTLDAAFELGVHLAVVPAGLLVPEPQRHAVLHENEQLKPGLYGADPHRTAAGSEITVTPWSVIAQEVLRDEDTAARALALQDAVGVEVDVARLDPGWALAMAAAQMPELSEVHEDAARLVRDAPVTPVVLRAAPDLARTHADLVGDALGRSTDDLLAAALDADRLGAADTAWRTYLVRALDDDGWMGRPDEVPLPPPGSSAWRHTAGFLDQIDDHLGRLAERAEGSKPAAAPAPSDALLVLRLADVAVRCGAAPVDAVARAAQHAVREYAAPLLLDHATARELVDTVGPLPEPTQLAVVRPAVAAAVEGLNRPRGERVPPAVLKWLFPEPPRPPADGAPVDPLVRELAAQVTAVVADPSAFAPQALVDTVRDVTADAPGDRTEAEVARLLGGRRWPPDELRAVAPDASRSPAVAEALLRSVLTEPNSALDGLLADLDRAGPAWAAAGAGGTEALLFSAASLRRLAQTWWRGPLPEVTSRSARELAATAATLLPAVSDRVQPELLADQLRASVAAAVAVAVVCWPGSRVPVSVGRPLLDTLHEEQVYAVKLIVAALQNAVVAEVELVHAALCGAPGYPLPATVPEPVRELGRLTVVVDGESAALLEHVVRRRARNAAFDPREMSDKVLHLVRQQLAPGSGYDSDDRLREVGAFAQLWWGRLGLPIDVGRARFPGRWSGS